MNMFWSLHVAFTFIVTAAAPPGAWPEGKKKVKKEKNNIKPWKGLWRGWGEGCLKKRLLAM